MTATHKRAKRIQAIAAALANKARWAMARRDNDAARENQERSARSYAAARRLMGVEVGGHE